MNLTAIGIIEAEEILRFDKKTMMYVVEYYISGTKYIAKRSYSEFKYLYDEINKTKPELPLPEIPVKKPLNKDAATINDRKDKFENLLKFLVENEIGLGYLAEFLLPFTQLPYYGKVVMNPCLLNFRTIKKMPQEFQSLITLLFQEGTPKDHPKWVMMIIIQRLINKTHTSIRESNFSKQNTE